MSDERLAFDPELKDNNIPEDIPHYVIGTVDEAEELGLPLEHYRTCARPDKASGIRGCARFGICPMSYRGKTVAEGGGPRRHGWERYKRGEKVRRMEGECWNLADLMVDADDNKIVYKVIANEGESYDKLVGVAIKTFVDTEGNTQKVLAKDGEYHLPNVQRGDMVVKHVVKPFLRPSENPDIASDVVTAEVVKKEVERLRGEAAPRALGITGGRAPIDKRNKRAGEGKSEG